MDTAVASKTERQAPDLNSRNNTVSRYTISFGLSLALCSLINALLVVAKEKSPAVQKEMQKLTGNHWITHAGIVLVLFFGFGFLFAPGAESRSATMPVNRLIKIITGGIFTAGIIIVAFYLMAD